MLMILYQFTFYAYLVLGFTVTLLKSVWSMLHYVNIVHNITQSSLHHRQYTILIMLLHVYLLCVNIPLVHCSAEISFNLISSASLINLLPNVS